MTPVLTRIVCAVLSTVGAAGLVAFANPANAVGGRNPVVRPAAGLAAIDVPANRG